MPICDAGDAFDPQEEGGLGPGGDSPNQGPAELPHTPVNLSGARCAAETPVIRIHQAQKTRLKLQLLDRNGQVIHFPEVSGSSTGSDSSSLSSSQPASLPYKFRFLVKQYSGAPRAVIDRPGTLIDAEQSIIQINLLPKHLCRAGLFTGQLLAYNDGSCNDTCSSPAAGCGMVNQGRVVPDLCPSADNDLLYWLTPYWVEISPSHHMISNGPPTLAELRLVMRDACPEANELLGDFEYSDAEIIKCIIDPIDQFNVTRPPITRYTTDTFPRQFRYYWVRASMALLMQIAARYYLREHLEYNAGGVSVNDKNKYDAYMKMAKELKGEWELWLVETKARLNVANGWGAVGSSYRRWVH